MTNFDELIKNYYIGHIDIDKYSIALDEFITKKYDIMSFYGSIILRPGNTILYTRDYISNIKGENVCYIVDNLEYTIDESTRLFPFLSPLKPIILNNKNEFDTTIIFKRWIIKLNLIDNLLTQDIKENSCNYYYGEIRSNRI